MTGTQRRQQLLDVARALLAEKGFEATSVEEIAHRAAVSKPVVYAHFGGKEGIYAVVVDREMRRVLDLIESALAEPGHPTRLIERAAQALVGMVALTRQWWLAARTPSRDEVAAHVVSLAWNGLSHLDHNPRL